MNAREYLSQVGIIDAKLKMIDANIEKIRRELRAFDDIGVSSSWPDGQPRGMKIGDPTGEKASALADRVDAKKQELKEKLLDLEYRSIQARCNLWTKRMEVIEMIDRIFDPDEPITKVYYRLLTLKYIEDKSWEHIAVDINYTWRHTYRLHGEALARMEKIING